MEIESKSSTQKLADAPATSNLQSTQTKKNAPPRYKALVKLERMDLDLDGKRFARTAGIQSNAEIWLGDRPVRDGGGMELGRSH